MLLLWALLLGDCKWMNRMLLTAPGYSVYDGEQLVLVVSEKVNV